MQACVFSLVNHTHTAPTEPLDDAVVRDNLADHRRESYVGEAGKSMKGGELAAVYERCWRKISITLITGFMTEFPADIANHTYPRAMNSEVGRSLGRSRAGRVLIRGLSEIIGEESCSQT
jgi:hypothetical protein